MDKAKEVVSKFISKDGQHNTRIDEDVRAPVTEKHVHPQKHDEVTTAVDREVHQHHHQTAIQPIHDKETLPTQHTSKTVPVQKEVINKGNDDDLKAVHELDKAKYKDTEQVHDTKTTASAVGAQGTHTHHHVHQHVQPVIQKEVVQPEVVHTTIPVHEVHNEAPVHHETTTLPAKTLDEFKGSARGTHGSNVRTVNEFDGCPVAKEKGLRGDSDIKDKIHGRE
ncbi:hypothetical protein Golomagni_06811 [Golovinomyces magnicellulatus]|nr:hypothetical protein Golomagni_06811 [Golovinomyces magnicellulatus]